jgi:hypothetical protein
MTPSDVIPMHRLAPKVDDGLTIPAKPVATIPWRRPEGQIDEATAKRRLQFFMLACATGGHLSCPPRLLG